MASITLPSTAQAAGTVAMGCGEVEMYCGRQTWRILLTEQNNPQKEVVSLFWNGVGGVHLGA